MAARPGRRDASSLLTGGELTTAAKQFLKDTARQFRLMHILFWADVVYRRTIDKGASLRVVLSHDGLDHAFARFHATTG